MNTKPCTFFWSILLLLAICLTANLVTAKSVMPVAAHGQLKLVNRQLCTEAGKAIQLRGMRFSGCSTPTRPGR
jgi:hypothetical protein